MTAGNSTTTRSTLSSILSKAGYSVIEACDGQEAMQMLNSQKIDMLVTDLNLENTSCIELIRTVRQLPGHRFMPIIMITPEDDYEMKDEGRKAGASGWITRPLCPDQLLSVARMVCPLLKNQLIHQSR